MPETPRRLIHAVLEYYDGRLQDDATVLFCQWLGPLAVPTDRAGAVAPSNDRPGEGDDCGSVPR